MSIGQRWSSIATGFERPFWVANISEIFERLSYYAVFSTLALYLNQTLHFSSSLAAGLSGFFGGAVWVMPIFGGAIADRIGFRRALSTAYLILTLAYFLVSSIGSPWLAPVRNSVPLPLLAGLVLFLPAFGVALVKPSVVGTTARASNDNVRSIGYSIYYTMVNIGSTAGPLLAGWLHDRLPTQGLYLIAALSVFAMFIVIRVFFQEPRQTAPSSASLKQTASDFLTIISNGRFVLFLLIFSGYWIVYWQQFITLALYINEYISKSANTPFILSTDPAIVIACTVLVSAFTRRLRPLTALIIGTLITSAGWLVLAIHGSVFTSVLALVIVAIGEITQAPRYYEYISRLAPEGQQATYLGFAFLPIGIGSFVGGLAGILLNYCGKQMHAPELFWVLISGLGIVTTVLLWLYDRYVLPSRTESA